MDKFRVVFMPAVEKTGEWFTSKEVGSFEIARTIKDNLADYTLFLHDKEIMIDYSNTAWIEQKVDGEWVDASDLEDDG